MVATPGILPRYNLSPVGSKAKPRKRRSSILKSPSRNALHDLDLNTGEERDTTSHAKKKKRLSSRRVSFANTYQVQEFLTAQQLNILEDTKAEQEDTQPFSPEKIDQQAAPANSTLAPPILGSSSDVSQSRQPDTSVGPGHCIRGLDILLSGPIKKQSATESFPKMLHCPEGSIIEPPVGAMYPSDGTAHLPSIDEDCEVSMERHGPETNTNERSDLKDAQQNWPGLTINPDTAGLIGPAYHCRLPVNESLSSSHHGSLSASSADQSKDQIFDLHDTLYFESTSGRDQFLSVFADLGEGKQLEEPVFAKKDTSSFLKSFMGSGDTLASQSPPKKQDNFLPVFADLGEGRQLEEPGFAKKDTSSFLKSFMGSGDTLASQSPSKKRDTKSFLNSLFGTEENQRFNETNQSTITTSRLDEHTSIFDQNALASEMEFTTCVSNKETEGCRRMDPSAFFKSLIQTESRGSLDSSGHSTFPSDDSQKTRVFGQTEATGAMDFTTCISGVIKEAGSVLHVSNQQDVTMRFGEDPAANMELTQCMDASQKKPTCSVQKPSGRVGRPLEDITRIFDGQMGGGEMELTTCGVIADSYNSSKAGNGQKNILNYKDADSAVTSCLEGQPFPLSVHKNDNTRIFHHTETATGMEMTVCLEGKPFPLQLSENGSSADLSKNLEKTRIFQSNEGTAAMEMTTCLEGQPFSLKSQVSISGNNSHKTLEKTRIFNCDETTAAMEMTTCLEGKPFTQKSQGNPPSIDSSSDLQQDAKAPNFPHSILEVDVTRLFSPNDTSCGMDMTECMDERPPSSLSGAVDKTRGNSRSPVDEKTEAFCGIPFIGSPFDEDDPFEVDKTKVFKPEDTAGMDFTACVGGLLPKTNPSKVTDFGEQSVIARKTTSSQKLNDEGQGHGLTLGSDKVQDDCTRRFASADNTARIELTTCVASEVSYTPAGTDDNLPRGGQGESTQIFSQGETAQMELTSCLSQLQPLPALASLSSKKSPRKAPMDQTTRMEITACIGGIFPIMSSDPSQTDHQQDKTRVFSPVDHAAGMEMTQCIGGLDLHSVERGGQSENLKEHTRVFTSEDTGKMEMTSCIGGLLPQPSGIDSLEAGSRELQPSHLHLPTMVWTGMSTEQAVPQDQTRIFTSENTASMDMTTCIGGVFGKGIPQSGNFSSQETLPDAPDSLPDQTRLFTRDNTGKMELTTCIGGINGSCLTQQKSADVCQESSQKGHPLPDTTCISTHDDTNKMEMTQCVGGIHNKAVELSTGAHSVEESSSSIDQREMGREAYSNASKKAKLSEERSVETLEKSISQEGQVFPVDQVHQDQTRIFTSEDTAAMEITRCMDQIPASSGDNMAPACVAADGIKQETILQSTLGQLLTDADTLAHQVDRPSKRDSDTFTIDPASGVIKASEQTTRRSDTYTLDTSPETSAVVANPPAATVSQRDGSRSSSTSDTSKRGSCEGEEESRDMIGELIQWGSLDSAAEGIDDEQPMWVENTEDFAQLSTQAGLASIILMEKKDHTASTTSHAFPTFSNDNGQGVILTSEIQDTEDTKSPDPSIETNEMMSSPDSNLQNENPMSSSCSSEPVSMQDFLSFVTINVKKGRRSVLPAIPKLTSAQTISDLLENRFLIQPRKVLYEWAINHLSTSIDKMQDEVNEQEQRLSENNPTVVTQVQHASPEHAAVLHEHIESLHKACSKMSKRSFQEWRLKMISKTHQSLQCVEAELNEILASRSSSSDALDKAMEDLNKYEDSLGKALNRLEQVQPPSQDQVMEFVNNQKMLVNRTAEVDEIKKTTAALESESVRLKSEIELYRKELVDVREEERLIESQVTSEDGLQDALVKLADLHCLQPWRLRKQSEEELVFTFLEESLVFAIKLGKKIEGSGGGNSEISSLHLDSSLAADNGVSANLAHNLIKASVDVTLLHTRHPTTATLKLLLQDVSEMVGQADGIADEIDRVSYRHVVTLNETNVTVEFSNLDAMVKFWVTFGLRPGSYPFGVISTDFKHKIGILKEEDIKEEVGKVTPGFAHFSRLVESIDKMIDRFIPSSPTI
ncbi:uncharacterized protein LOC117297806 [Asterias rubens]|uniref:uncharacterized protein LOC117297806 n=1 Tax=Asterias rubens TaxID=7604 RepID=UPI00145577CD|nr:uncharacterized protein LOC117297806 [Asterias rubens]